MGTSDAKTRSSGYTIAGPTLSPATALAMSSSIERSLQNVANPATPPNDVIASSTATSRIRGIARICRRSRWASRPRARPRLVVRRLTLWMIGSVVVCAGVMPCMTRMTPHKFQGHTILCESGVVGRGRAYVRNAG